MSRTRAGRAAQVAIQLREYCSISCVLRALQVAIVQSSQSFAPSTSEPRTATTKRVRVTVQSSKCRQWGSVPQTRTVAPQLKRREKSCPGAHVRPNDDITGGQISSERKSAPEGGLAFYTAANGGVAFIGYVDSYCRVVVQSEHCPGRNCSIINWWHER